MIVYAVNVHTGGGQVLLDEVITGKPFGSISTLFVDSRFNSSEALKLGLSVKSIAPSFWARLTAERALHKLARAQPKEEILFFGNLPPLKRIPNHSILYLQNCFLLKPIPIPTDNLKTYLRILIERYWVRFFIRNIDQVLVQTNWMLELFNLNYSGIKVQVRPFIHSLPSINSTHREYDFICVTSLSNHKNLKTVLGALHILDLQIKQKCRICLVIDAKENSKISHLVKSFSNIEVDIFYSLSQERLRLLYVQAKWCIIASSYESFCLPLHEAHFYGCKILALETPFATESKKVDLLYEKNDVLTLSHLLKKVLDSL